MKGLFKPILFLVLFLGVGISTGVAQGWKFGIGFDAGVSRLEGDLISPQLSPLISGHLRILPMPYLALNGNLGFASLTSSKSSDPINVKDNFQSKIIPFELSVIFNFMPFSKINPYIFAGGGGVFWSTSADTGAVINVSLDDGLDSFLKTGAGLEFRLSPRFALDLGATFRLSFTDVLDFRKSGNEDDQVLDVHVGFTYYFSKSGGDRDNDSIPDEFDLMPDIAEDQDGYLDHDGIPEKNPNPFVANTLDPPMSGDNSMSSPIVIHHLINKAESGKNLQVKAHVFSNIDLRVVAALYRPVGTRKWNVVKLEETKENFYQGDIPSYAITTDGVEYCVVAVDETLNGVGYAGLPSKPIFVNVSRSGTPWRIAGGVIGAATVGAASYFVMKKQ